MKMTIPLSRSNLTLPKICIYLCLALILALAWWLWFKAGDFLTQSENHHAKVALVLEGQWPTSYRTDHGLALLKSGQVDTLVVSGNYIAFAPYQASHIYAQDLIGKGAPAHRLVSFSHMAQSTWDEARAVIPRLRAMGVDSVAIISSNFHLRRATWIFNLLAQGKPFFYALPAGSDPDFDPQNWMHSREGTAIFVVEWCKMINTFKEAYLSAKPRSLIDSSETRWDHW